MMDDQARIDAVIEFCNNVLTHGRDRYRNTPSPLFRYVINIDTLEQVKWNLPGTGEVVISNLAIQQHLFRTLPALSQLLDEPIYQAAAKDSIRYHFQHLADS